ncbi:MAG TPA: hypothetical protein PLP34_06610 [Chitinophagaceae bacterium]|nr:hypothetical protein [Chitinophagaceae bacterium]HNF72064.1 hypothetical protein [Chitinophagaceae bacterium]
MSAPNSPFKFDLVQHGRLMSNGETAHEMQKRLNRLFRYENVLNCAELLDTNQRKVSRNYMQLRLFMRTNNSLKKGFVFLHVLN